MYYLKKKDGDSVYSVDRFTFDFYFLPEGGLYDLLKTSLDVGISSAILCAKLFHKSPRL